MCLQNAKLPVGSAHYDAFWHRTNAASKHASVGVGILSNR
jgi:hypothetical protein